MMEDICGQNFLIPVDACDALNLDLRVLVVQILLQTW